ncbi:hypothetical protein [Nitrosomonas communis]|uniref:hypothetical protein n=1 Tax=Nitrosomonas communis TaxID=44574 RepID=UPI0026EF45D7|nr:hypothetical protein [Nitrosomonas communis]MCO6428747.1 hypothetical protein [Nitrosomonas communis]
MKGHEVVLSSNFPLINPLCPAYLAESVNQEGIVLCIQSLAISICVIPGGSIATELFEFDQVK